MIAYDRRGRTTPPDPDYSVNVEVEDAHRVLDKAGPNPILLGHEPDHGQVNAPARILLGDNNIATMPFGIPTDSLAKDIGGELVLLKDLGHVAHIEAPDRLAEAITS